MPEVKDQRPLATTEQVATYLNLSVSSLHDLRRRSRAPKAFKVGRSLRWKWSDIDAWLESKAS